MVTDILDKIEFVHVDHGKCCDKADSASIFEK